MSFYRNAKKGKLQGKKLKGLRDHKYERDPVVLLKQYFKGLFLLDLLANFPISLFEIFNGLEGGEEKVRELVADNDLFKIFMVLKLLRFAHVNKVIQSLIMMKDILADIFYLHRYELENLLQWTLAAIKFILSVHLFGCI